MRAGAVSGARQCRVDEALAERLRQLIALHPTFGYRRLWALLRFAAGLKINRKAVYRVYSSSNPHSVRVPPVIFAAAELTAAHRNRRRLSFVRENTQFSGVRKADASGQPRQHFLRNPLELLLLVVAGQPQRDRGRARIDETANVLNTLSG